MPVDLFFSDRFAVQIAVLRGVVSPVDLIRAVYAQPPSAPASCGFVSFSSAGLFALSLEGITAAMETRSAEGILRTLVLYAPSQLSFGVARMLQSGAGLGQRANVQLECNEALALGLAGLPATQVTQVVACARKLPQKTLKRPLRRRAEGA